MNTGTSFKCKVVVSWSLCLLSLSSLGTASEVTEL